MDENQPNHRHTVLLITLSTGLIISVLLNAWQTRQLVQLSQRISPQSSETANETGGVSTQTQTPRTNDFPEGVVATKQWNSGKGFTFSAPQEWLILPARNAYDQWIATENGKEKAVITCMLGGRGYEAWDFTTTEREYTQSSKTYAAKMMVGKPKDPEAGNNWAIIILGKGSDGFYENGCSIEIMVSNPPTKTELSLAEQIYKSIQ